MELSVITDPIFYLAAIPAVLIVGASKSGFGGGLGIIAVPLLSLVVSPQMAAAILLPVLCVIDLFALAVYRKTWHAPNLKILLPAAIFGIVFGTVTFHVMTEEIIKGLVALVAITFTLHHWFRRKSAEDASTDVSVVKGGFWGAVSGFTSFIAHAGGPPISVYLLPQRLNKTLFVGTTVIFFIIVNYVKLIPYAWLGQFPISNLTTSATLLPIALVGSWLGVWAHRRISEIWFYRLAYIMTFFVGLKLAQEAVMGEF